ncbi:signal recognition particle, SRP9/SRP14 subunit [Syncephalis plumigaleata]|nr:signal recognition particle, SRP9/SRP14 subunit [Syncephalis plumigaleata]
MTRISNDKFIELIPALFASARDTHTIYLTQKRYDYTNKPKRLRVNEPSDAECKFACLWRLVCDTKKYSTVVEPEDQTKFLVAYAAAVRSQATSLKKKEKRRKRTAAKPANGNSYNNILIITLVI